VVRYRLKSATIAVEQGRPDGRMQLLTVPAGALIELAGEVQQSGLIDVKCKGRIVAMFLQDIENRSEKVLVKDV
jgi:hypothetical protein